MCMQTKIYILFIKRCHFQTTKSNAVVFLNYTTERIIYENIERKKENQKRVPERKIKRKKYMNSSENQKKKI